MYNDLDGDFGGKGTAAIVRKNMFRDSQAGTGAGKSIFLVQEHSESGWYQSASKLLGGDQTHARTPGTRGVGEETVTGTETGAGTETRTRTRTGTRIGTRARTRAGTGTKVERRLEGGGEREPGNLRCGKRGGPEDAR